MGIFFLIPPPPHHYYTNPLKNLRRDKPKWGALSWWFQFPQPFLLLPRRLFFFFFKSFYTSQSNIHKPISPNHISPRHLTFFPQKKKKKISPTKILTPTINFTFPY